MKLCEIVLAFHQRPKATSGTDGTVSSSAACSAESAISRLSHREYRSTEHLYVYFAALSAASRSGEIIAFPIFTTPMLVG